LRKLATTVPSKAKTAIKTASIPVSILDVSANIVNKRLFYNLTPLNPPLLVKERGKTFLRGANAPLKHPKSKRVKERLRLS
jgi:hypothetical protein